jgi:D-methionine transport system permease protein
MNEITLLLWQATLETLYMVALSACVSGLLGLIGGVLLVTTAPGNIAAAPLFWRVLTALVNFGRSVPFIILMVAVVPFTRLIVGTSIGTDAAVVPLIIAAIPYVARLVENALLEVDRGVIEAVITMGATPWQVVVKCYLPVAIRYGYQRFRPDVTIWTVLLLVALVQLLQFAGDRLARYFDHRQHQ